MEIIKLNLIPSGVNPTCHCSQYDDGRVIRIELFDGLTPYTLQSGDTVTLNVRKPDNTIVTASVTATQGNKYVDIVTTEQICACVGYNLCDLTITNGSVVIGTLNFIMQVERDVLADGIPSQSVIEDLDERIGEAIGDNYYNKTETDALLNNKADKSNTYTKTETDSLLALKADKSDTYTKSETDALLALKADKSEIYNTYPTDTASGPIASFTDGADNIPVKSLITQIVAQQAGSGDPSPSNPRAISGFSSGVVSVCGKNLINLSDKSGSGYIYNKEPIFLKSGSYVFSIDISASGGQTLVLRKDNTEVFRRDFTSTIGRNSIPFTISDDANNISLYSGVSGTFANFQIELGETATTYEAYNGNAYTFAFGQTVYGGHFDNKGNLVVTHGFYTFDGTENFGFTNNRFYYSFPTIVNYTTSQVADLICSTYPTTAYQSQPDHSVSSYATYLYFVNLDYSDIPTFKASLVGTTIAFKLATPITLAITTQDIPTLLGNNSIFADTGDVEVNYRADIGLYIDKKISQIPTALNSTRGSEELRTISAPVITDEIRDEEPIETPTNDEER